MPRIVHVLAFDNAQVLDVTGPLQVFASTNDLARQRGLPLPYAVSVIAAQAEPVMTSAGLALLAEPLPALDAPCDTLVIAGGWGVYGAAEDPALVEWVREKARHTRRMTSVCTGAFLLAASGMLDGCRVATHWTRCEELARKFPALTVESNPIFIQQGAVWTSAGVTAGIDLCLALVEEDLGSEVALEVARHLVVFLKRPGGQAQFSQVLQAQTADSASFDALHAWISDNLRDSDLSVERLAAQSHMSPRNFARVYKQKTGRTPAKAIELFRMEAARRMLEDSQRSIDQIAGLCGFGDEERMRCTFHRHLAISPRDYRERFSR